jgi:tetratricopeptide (TPR) repeat protein
MFLDRGLCLLARHNPQEAVRYFENALRECPASRGADLYRICFYMGVALQRLGHPETAIKSWVSCQRLKKRGHIRKLLSRLTNPYGMEKQKRSELDDWKAFASVQLTRYLLSKNKRTFSTRAEQDMVVDLIRDYWDSLAKSGVLAGKSCAEKHAIFTRTQIVFPTILIPQRVGEPVIPVNFHTQKRVNFTDRCYCGSGQPFHLCCGRTPGNEEVLSGIF